MGIILKFISDRYRSHHEKYLYNFDPLKPHFYIVKLGFTGVYIIFLISAQNVDCGYSLEPPHQGGSNETKNLCFEQKYEKYQFFIWKFSVSAGEIFNMYLYRRVFVMLVEPINDDYRFK